MIPEVAALGRRGHELTIVPVHGRGPVLHEDARDLLDSCLERSLLSVAIVRGAARQLARRPGRSLRAFRLLLGSRSPRILLKNLAVLPKGLWLGLRGRAARDRPHPRALGRDELDAGADREPAVGHPLERHGAPLGHRREQPARGEGAAGGVRAGDQRDRAAQAGGRDGRTSRAMRSSSTWAWTCRPASRRRRRARRVLAAASLREVKGHVYLFEAARLLRERGVDVRIECVGDGPLRPELERYVARARARLTTSC